MNRFFIVLILLIAAGYTFYNYLETGRISVLPVKLTPVEQEILSLEKQLKQVNRELASIERQAKEIGLSMAQVTIAEKDRLEEKKAQLLEKLSQLKP